PGDAIPAAVVPDPEPDPGSAGAAPVPETVVPGPEPASVAPVPETVVPGPEPASLAPVPETVVPGPEPASLAPVPETVVPGPEPASLAPVPETVVPGPEPDPWPAGPAPSAPPPARALPGMRSWSRPQGRPAGPDRPPRLPRPPAAERASAMAARFAGGWPFGRVIGVGVLIVGLFSLLAIGVGGTALADLTTAREQVVNTLDPAAFHASQLEVELLNQETGVRGYALSAQPSFL